MATLNNDFYTAHIDLGEDHLSVIYDVLIGAACALEGVSAIMDELSEADARIGALSYAADEIICLQRSLLNVTATEISRIQKADKTEGDGA